MFPLQRELSTHFLDIFEFWKIQNAKLLVNQFQLIIAFLARY